MTEKLELKWQCRECGEIHEFEDDAYDCFAPWVIDGYTCPECGDFHRDEVDALACCGYDEDALPSPQNAAELKAAGQLRLLP